MMRSLVGGVGVGTGARSAVLADRLAAARSRADVARIVLSALVIGGRRTGWLLLHGQPLDRAGPDAADEPPLRGTRHRLDDDWSIVIDGPADDAVDDDEVLTAGRVAMRLVERLTALEPGTLTAERGRRQFEILLEVQRLVAHRSPRQQVLDRLVAGAAELLRSDGACVHERDPDDHARLVMSSSHGVVRRYTGHTDLASGDSLTAQVVREGRVVAAHTKDGRASATPCLSDVGITASLGAPIRVRGEVVGAVTVVATDPVHRYSQDDERVIATFAQQAGLAIADARIVAEREEALHDHLTGLPARRLLIERLDAALERRAATGTDVAALFLDLDRFKPINDTLGHEAGDEVLRTIAERLEHVLRHGDVAGRIGGDEFAVLLTGASARVAGHVAERLIRAVEQPIEVAGRSVAVGLSVGVAVADDDARATGAEALLRAADLALYNAKRHPGSSWSHHDHSMDLAAAERLDLDSDIRTAVDRGELRLVYQPIVGTSGLTVEALLRWRHPVRGDIVPTELVRHAEATGDIHRIGAWVLLSACEQVARWRHEHGLDVTVSVNLSRRQLDDDGLLPMVQRTLVATGVRPDQLALEVTESAAAAHDRFIPGQLAALRRLGVAVAIDDFGTGESSLAQLRHLSFDRLKLDRSLVPASDDDRVGWALVDITRLLAERLELDLVVEGVETAAQHHRLASLGCDAQQGYHVAPPMEAAEATAWLLDRAPTAD